MRTHFVNTENSKRLLRAVDGVENRGSEEACFAVVDGDAGLGKTTTIRWWVVQNQCTYLRCKATWNASRLLLELCRELGCVVPRSLGDRLEVAIRELSQRHASASALGRTYALVFDEVDHIANSRIMMETLRDLGDQLELPIILVAMRALRPGLIKFPQITSRVSQYVQFEKASKEDVRRFMAEKCEFEVDETLSDFIHKISGGYNREIKEAINKIEHFGNRHDLEGRPIALHDMAGQLIMNDRNSGKPIYGPEV